MWPNGEQRWRCLNGWNTHDVKRMRRRRAEVKPYRQHVKNTCEECGFSHPSKQVFDVHHVDGNHHNNELSNLRTLCPTCHRVHHLG